MTVSAELARADESVSDSTTRASRASSSDWHRFALAAILLVAFALRAWNLDWDRGTHLQPDERFWSDVAANVNNPDDWDLGVILDPERSPLNPRVYKPTYVYGTLPLWASEAAAGVLMTDNMQWATSALDGLGINLLNDQPSEAPPNERRRFDTGYNVTIVGRLMSAIVDTFTVAAVYALGRTLGDRTVGLLAAFLQAMTVLHIQYSHFLGSEPWVAFFVTITVLGSVRLAKGLGGWRTRLCTAAALGCAIGSKLSGIAVAAAPIVALAVLVGPDLIAAVSGSARRRNWRGIFRTVEPWLVMGVVAVVFYRVVQPYDFQAGISLMFNGRFLADVEYLSDINQGGNWPWVHPLVGATPLWHPLKQAFLWGMGPGLGLAAAFGIARAAFRWKQGERYWAVPLAVIGAYFVLVSLQFYAIIRYLQPTYPIMTALAAVGLVASWRWASSLGPERVNLRRLVQGTALVCVGATAFWALAFVNGVYGQDNARLAAGDWVSEQLPAGASVSVQEWDDPIPWGRASSFNFVTLRPFSFGGDSIEQIERLVEGLDQVDYVIESSNKFYDSLPRTPARFPQITTYYERLFDETLGFELIATFRNQPSLFGLGIDDSSAEEAFTLYDHPTVHIWQKTDLFSVERAYQLLNPDRARTSINSLPKDSYANASMLTPTEYATQQNGSSFSDVHSNPASGVSAVVGWFTVIQIAAFATVPWIVRLGGRSAGAAYGLSKIVGLLAFAMPVWLLVSTGVFNFSRGLVVWTLLAVASSGIWRGWTTRGALRRWWVANRRWIVAAECVFVAVFLSVVLLRSANPDLWHPWRGGEKPMELAYFTAVTGSTTLPPFDPWFAGGTLNYYYVGWFLVAVPTRLLGLMPDVAFNLSVATYAALAAVTVFATVSLLVDQANRTSQRRLPQIRTGLLGVVLFLIIGNLDSLRQVIVRVRENQPLSDFDWWGPSRVNKDSPGFEVTEFPSFTVFFADLHPHFMAMPIFGLGLALCVGHIHATRTGQVTRSWLLAAALGALTGILRMVHTWDLPTIGIAVLGAICIAWVSSPGRARWRCQAAIGQLLVAGVVHLAVTAPYRASNQVADSGFKRSESQTNLDDWLVHWGIFLFVGCVYVATRFWQRREDVTEVVQRSTQFGAIGLVAVAAVGLHMSVGSVAAWALVGLGASMGLLVVEVFARYRSTAHLMVAACWTLAFAVLVGVESFTQNNDIARLNTVFKFWLQVWHLFAVAAAFSAAWVIASAAPLVAHQAANARTRAFDAASRRRIFMGTLGALIACGMLYPILTLRPRIENRFNPAISATLDGHEWFEPGQALVGIRSYLGEDSVIDPGRDRPLVDWLRDNVQGRPTIVEAVGGAEYQWWGRMSITTGLPTVVGWRWHQVTQRPLFGFKVNERNRDVGDFYTTDQVDVIDRFLRAYDVEYVIVGTLEAATANPATLALLAEHRALDPVFTFEDLVIYEVSRPILSVGYAPIFVDG